MPSPLLTADSESGRRTSTRSSPAVEARGPGRMPARCQSDSPRPVKWQASLAGGRQVVERNNAVGFCPQSNLPGRVGLVVGIDQGLAIKVADDVVPSGDHSQSMPLVGSDLHV